MAYADTCGQRIISRQHTRVSLFQTKMKKMEVISIEARTFEEMKQALSSIIRNIHGHLSEKITVSAQYGKNTVQQDRQKDLLPEERHKHVYGETIAKRKLLIVMIWHKTC